MHTRRLAMKGITKRFSGVVALSNVSLQVDAGEIHALIGENGAGKSTLMNILGGLISPNEGEISIDGEPVSLSDPVQAYGLGIGFVHQESNLLTNLTVAENVFLGHELTWHQGPLDRAGMEREVLRLNQQLKYSLNPSARIGDLSLSERQCVEIMRAVRVRPRILILDEPTAALNEDEVQRLFRTVRDLSAQGTSVIYISHRLEEVLHLCDRVTVLKDGANVGTLPRGEVDKDLLVTMMVGRVLEDIYPDRSQVSFGKPILHVRDLSVPKQAYNVSFTLHQGEILGLGGLEGQGQRAILQAIFGDAPISSGCVEIGDTKLSSAGIAGRIRHGIAYLTHDRHGEGLILHQPVLENASLAALNRLCNAFGFIKRQEESCQVKAQVEQMQIRVSSVQQAVQSLSGGNQQKVMLARWLLTKPKILLVDEPTRGVDVGARMSIYQIIDQMTRQGIGIIMLTSDMMELIGLSDRILVLCDGMISQELSRAEATEENIMRASSSMEKNSTV